MPEDTTITARTFTSVRGQATIFTPDEEVSSKKLVQNLVPKWADHYDGEPLVIPAPDGAPREIPRLVLQKADGSERCEISSARINLFLEGTHRAPIELPEFFDASVERLLEYKELLNARAGRLAAVILRVAECQDPARFLSRHFCRERWWDAPFDRPGNFEVNAHKRYTLQGSFSVNSWVKNRAGAGQLGQFEARVVTVEQDINTLPEEADFKNYSEEQIRQFFGIVVEEFSEILALYYPEELK